ncbi:hypothetical protein I79_006392 [Cricetulus griseus]|uniref:Uncharacterized protein n=1 Tax=Cricetulus griseus TaxID=10029 RepID=G3H7Q6_CRIGR|nr:hypothetical protein I79_006392 [Cricetulus griseus]
MPSHLISFQQREGLCCKLVVVYRGSVSMHRKPPFSQIYNFNNPDAVLGSI